MMPQLHLLLLYMLLLGAATQAQAQGGSSSGGMPSASIRTEQLLLQTSADLQSVHLVSVVTGKYMINLYSNGSRFMDDVATAHSSLATNHSAEERLVSLVFTAHSWPVLNCPTASAPAAVEVPSTDDKHRRVKTDDTGPAAYDVSWNYSSPEGTRTKSNGNYACKSTLTYADAMPLGNGDLAVLAWANTTAGGVSMYIRKADAMNSGASLLTLGLLEISLTPNPFHSGAYFNQTLHFESATVSILAGGTSFADHEMAFEVRVDATSNVMWISAKGKSAKKTYYLTAQLSSVRPVSPCAGVLDASKRVSPFSPDLDIFGDSCAGNELSNITAAALSDAVVLFHRNPGNIFNKTTNTTVKAISYIETTMASQNISELVPTVIDWWTHAQTGVALTGNALAQDRLTHSLQRAPTPSPDSSKLVSVSAAGSFELAVHALTKRTPSVSSWLETIARNVKSGGSMMSTAASHAAKWDEFWSRSFVYIPTTSNPTLSPQYAIARYVNNIQSRTMWPIKFNGMLFGAERHNKSCPGGIEGGVNKRLLHLLTRSLLACLLTFLCLQLDGTWGNMEYWQNLRLPYWSMHAAGDFDSLETVFKYYKNMIAMVSARTMKYWNHTGIAFHETKNHFGAWSNGPISHNWTQWEHERGGAYWASDSGWMGKDYGGNAGGTEVSYMLLNAYEYTLNETLLEEYLPIAKLTIDFFRQHYLNRTASGKMVIWPTQALETWWCAGWDYEHKRPPADCCVDDMPTVAALHALLEKMLTVLPHRFVSATERDQWVNFNATLPPMPTNDTHVLPAAEWNASNRHNSEIPELYSVHPYRHFTVGRQLTSNTNLSKVPSALV
jgi:hypothetical protein